MIPIETAFLFKRIYFSDRSFAFCLPNQNASIARGCRAHTWLRPPASQSAGMAPPPSLSLVAMETRRWQHPAVCSASILIPLRGAAECLRCRHRYVTHCKMASARRMVCFVLFTSLGKLFSLLLCDISAAPLGTLRGASLRYVTQRPMLM